MYIHTYILKLKQYFLLLSKLMGIGNGPAMASYSNRCGQMDHDQHRHPELARNSVQRPTLAENDNTWVSAADVVVAGVRACVETVLVSLEKLTLFFWVS
jgi:hypothetical protein